MSRQLLTGYDSLVIIEKGFQNLSNNCEEINSLNVFPVPDGDTGTNMKTTLQGGIEYAKKNPNDSIAAVTKSIARGMILSARGNSGVILSQFFKGVSNALSAETSCNLPLLAEMMLSGSKRSYEVVSNPTEGTILTVMREAGEEAKANIDKFTSIEEYFDFYLEAAKKSLSRTPDLLPILKKSGVIDSGGAGFVKIIEGICLALKGDTPVDVLSPTSEPVSQNVTDEKAFDANSILTYGYCTEFLLQLQNSKVDTKSFDEKIILDYLKTIGDSIVCFKEEDIVKVHVHTKDPGKVLTYCRKFGEFITIKIENMNVQHSENAEFYSGMELDTPSQDTQPVKEHKKYATVAVCNGDGLYTAFKELGVDVVVSGGQTMNTSTSDFIHAFEQLDAEHILVFPNNKNIKLAAKLAADTYDSAKVHVLPTYSIAEGYSAISMLNFDLDDIQEIIQEELDEIKNVHTLEITYSIRDTVIDDIQINKGDYICMYAHKLIAADKEILSAIKKAFDAMEDFKDFQVMTIFAGDGVTEEELNKLETIAHEKNRALECFSIKGDQKIYRYIIGLE